MVHQEGYKCVAEGFLDNNAGRPIRLVGILNGGKGLVTADKAVIRQLCELNPSLIAVLDKSTLLEIGISKAKIIKTVLCI